MSSLGLSGNSGSSAGTSSSFSLQGTKEFLQSNSLVAKFAFLLLIIILFVMVLRQGVALLNWIFSPSGNPHMIDGMIDARHMLVIPQDPSKDGAKPILRSNNQRDGIEFTWSVWIYIDDLDYGAGTFKHIFHKGNDDINYTQAPTGLNEPNNGPGLYITPNKNNLLVIMNTFDKIKEKIIIEDVPLNKWINVVIRVNNLNLDVFVNGSIVVRHVFSGPVKQNYGDVFVSANNGFDGMMSNLRYFNHALGTTKIQSIVMKGPNLKIAGVEDTVAPPYLGLRWYLFN